MDHHRENAGVKTSSANYRILTPRFHALPVLSGELFSGANYPFSTPRFRTASVSFLLNSAACFRGVRNR
jgi:hypothetical protein